jgi:2-polyprenyl-3-methyl-5-hydroxy-6-metoxy-1,4-benzoquinol methylase
VKYFKNTRNEIFPLLDFGSVNHVVEFGCADGSTLKQILTIYPHIDVHGFDYDFESVEAARKSGIKADVVDINSLVEVGEIANPVMDADVILLLDVLEHINNPEGFLKFLSSNTKEKVTVVISLPNVRNWRTFVQLFRNDWKYEKIGIFDETHLRFYAKKSALRLATNFGTVSKFTYRYSVTPWKALLQSVAPSFICGQMFCVVVK